jgi:hypothetical protein
VEGLGHRRIVDASQPLDFERNAFGSRSEP